MKVQDKQNDPSGFKKNYQKKLAGYASGHNESAVLLILLASYRTNRMWSNIMVFSLP